MSVQEIKKSLKVSSSFSFGSSSSFFDPPSLSSLSLSSLSSSPSSPSSSVSTASDSSSANTSLSPYLFSIHPPSQGEKFCILPLFFVFVAPSGTGKTSLRRALLEELPNLFFSISATTREEKKQEKHGRDYWFLSQEEFQCHINQGHFLEHVKVFDHYYGTPHPHIGLEFLQQHREKHPSSSGYEGFLHASKHCFKKIPMDILMDTDHQGAMALKKIYGHRLTTIFLLPPNFSTLEKRLRQRNRDQEESLKKRLHQAQEDIHFWPFYDYTLVNKDFSKTLHRLKTIIEAKRLQRSSWDGSLQYFVDSCF